MALCLLSACLTGSLLAFKPELDAWLNPQIFRIPASGSAPLDEDALRAALKRQSPTARVRWIEPPRAAGDPALANVAGWRDPNDAAHRINEVFVHPVTGAVLGARSTTNPRFNRLEFVHWLHRFHYMIGLQRTGMLIMGGVAIAWFVDSLAGSLLTLPPGSGRWRRWLRTWKVRRQYVAYDLHRASSLWLWPLLMVMSVSSIYLNLTQEVFMPAIDGIGHLLPEIWRRPVVESVLEWQEPLHTGSAFGLAGRITVCLTGLGAAVGIGAGLLSWLRRSARRPMRGQ